MPFRPCTDYIDKLSEKLHSSSVSAGGFIPDELDVYFRNQVVEDCERRAVFAKRLGL